MSLLEGKFKEVKADLTAQMEQAAEELRFEKAAQIRDRIKAIQLLGERQKVVGRFPGRHRRHRLFPGRGQKLLCVLHYLDGELAAKDMDLMERPMEEETGEILSALLRQYYAGAPPAPADFAPL